MSPLRVISRLEWCAATVSAVSLLSISTAGSLAQCQRSKLRAIDGEFGDKFAFSVGAEDQIAVVGVPFDDDHGSNSGSARVFARSHSAWTTVAKFTPDDGVLEDGFGWSVAISGNLIVIGVPYDDDLGIGSGSAYVFEYIDGAWSQAAKLLADDGDTYDRFGWALAVSGNLTIIGAFRDDDNGPYSGSAYVFERDPNGLWSQAAKLLADDGDADDVFGDAVAIDGDVIVVGAQDDEALGNWSGSAYVFERDPNDVWSQTAKLLPHDGGPFWFFGESVAVSGNRILVGASRAHTFAPSGGAAYIFERDPNGAWPQVAQIVSDDIANSDVFGASVALCGDVAVIGAWGDDDHGQQTGAAYVFVRQPEGSWSQVAKLLADDGAAYDKFGNAVAVSGNTAVIGAYYDDDNGEDSGSAYVFAVGPDEDGDGIMDVCLCPGDLDHDLDVDLSDLAQLLSNYGTTSSATYEDGDLDEDGDVDLSDLAALLAEYGTVCP